MAFAYSVIFPLSIRFKICDCKVGNLCSEQLTHKSFERYVCVCKTWLSYNSQRCAYCL